MTHHDLLEIRSLLTLLRETLIRADEQAAYLLNPKDPGLVETLRALSAENASRVPGPGRKPIAGKRPRRSRAVVQRRQRCPTLAHLAGKLLGST